MSDFGTALEVVGRKEHRCEWCGEAIAEGETHFHYKGRFWGDWQDWRMHPECYAIHNNEDPYGDGSFEPYNNPRGAK